ncbi:SLAM family member 8 [Amia ocellicauda]|uniref:SLAM family member 8 n=1 Tax=Amia ocellicauda TaxID=2972642 RepID=UPI0034646CA7
MGLSRVFLLCLSALSALCPAPAQSERRLLRGIVGEALSFNSSVSQNGFLNYGGSNIAMVLGGQITGPKGRFDGRLHWDNETGLFHITELSNQDSGEYIVQDTGGQRRVTVFQLTVYNSVSKPEVTNKTQVSVQCPLLCSVSNGREVTLSWYREGEEKPLKHTSSPDLNTPLTLPLETEGLSHSYSCVATNPVSTQNTTVHPADYCTVDPGSRRDSCSHHSVLLLALPALKIGAIAVFSVLSVITLLTMVRISANLQRLREQLRDSRYRRNSEPL